MSVAAPAPRTTAARRTTRSKARRPSVVTPGRRRGLLPGAVLWVVLLAALFGGIVALNVGALRGTIEADAIEAETRAVRTQNAEVAAEVAELSGFWRVTQRAEELGMVQAKPQARDFVPFVRGSAGRNRPAPSTHADEGPLTPR